MFRAANAQLHSGIEAFNCASFKVSKYHGLRSRSGPVVAGGSTFGSYPFGSEWEPNDRVGLAIGEAFPGAEACVHVSFLLNFKQKSQLTKIFLHLKNYPKNFRNNPLNCTCANKWLFNYQSNTKNQSYAAHFLNLPSKVQLDEHLEECKAECPEEEIKLQVTKFNV
jgi:hypothetical protein